MELEALLIYSKDKISGDDFSEEYMTGTLEEILEEIKEYEEILETDRITIRDDMLTEVRIFGVPLVLTAKKDGILWRFVHPAFIQNVVRAYSKLKNRTERNFIKQPLKPNGKFHLFSITHNDNEHIRIAVRY
jgi:hypothetical protein